MKVNLALFAAFVGLVLSSPANAASCHDRARMIVQQQGGTLISVSVSGSDCVIRVLVPKPNGPPVRRTFRVAK